MKLSHSHVAEIVITQEKMPFTTCSQKTSLALLVMIGLLSISLGSWAAAPGVSALGFIEPENGIINVSGAVSQDGTVVSQLTVKEGDSVVVGQVIAVLNNHDRLQAALRRAEARLAIAQAKLKQLMAGPRQGLVKAQEQRIARIQIQLGIAQKECQRFKTLRAKGTASEAAVVENCLDQRTLAPSLLEAKAQLEDMQEIRPEDIAVLEAQVNDADAALSQAHANYDRSFVRAPIAGQVLQVFTRAGETIDGQGIVGIGNTDAMWVTAEVYETDATRVKQGQRAEVQVPGVDQVLHGDVQKISLLVGRNKILSLNPTANADARVVEVGIRLDAPSSELVRRMTNLQVSVVISID